MLRRCGIRVLVVALVLGGCSGASSGPDQTTAANLSTSSMPMTSTTSRPATTTVPTSTTTVPVSSVLEVRLVTASYSDGLAVAGDAVTFRPAFQGADEKTARLTPTAAARLEQWLETAAAMSLLDVYNDGRGINDRALLGVLVPTAVGQPGDGVLLVPRQGARGPEAGCRLGRRNSPRDGAVRPHPDLIDRDGCEDWLPPPAERASLTVGESSRRSRPGVRHRRRLAGACRGCLGPGQQLRQVLESVSPRDRFSGEVTATVAVRCETTAPSTRRRRTRSTDRVCFMRSTPSGWCPSCQRMLGRGVLGAQHLPGGAPRTGRAPAGVVPRGDDRSLLPNTR